MKKTLLPVSLLLVSLMPVGGGALGAQAEPTLEQRLTRLERILQNQSLSDIVLQLQRLQREVQQLRGQLEVQRHELDALENRQRELYLDLDQRLTRTPEPVPLLPVAPQQPEGAPVVEAPQQPAGQPDRPPVVPADPDQEKPAYQNAFTLLKQGNYPQALSAFQAFVATYPNGALVDNAQYWLGETSYVTRDYDTAMADFEKVLTLYPASDKVPGALLKMGYIHVEKRRWTEAKDVLGRIVRDYPNTTEARLAQNRLDRVRAEGH
jgi:tol-pal system protein YbgF